MKYAIAERDESGRVQLAYSSSGAGADDANREDSVEVSELGVKDSSVTDVQRFLSSVFLPAGYPASVSPDYLRYQIYNALQAFCSSLTGLLASRAVLEGHGVGNASASATNAVLLTVVQDIFSRLTTIAAGYRLGPRLSPEAKTFRLLADIFNDAAIVLDVLSPFFSSLALSFYYPFVRQDEDSGALVRVAALCLSGAFRALCGVVAGGSKAALTMHFASDGKTPGDVGDLNAKDGSKETVLGLLGMLGGTIVMHYVHNHTAVYLLFAILVVLHLLVNYAAVRVVVMRTLNRHRANILWMASRASYEEHTDAGPKTLDTPVVDVPTPEMVSVWERIFTDSSALYVYSNDGTRSPHPLGKCTLGSTFNSLLRCYHRSPLTTCQGQSDSKTALSTADVGQLLDLFKDEDYILWFDACPQHIGNTPHLHICLKDSHTPITHLRSWCHAQELALLLRGVTPSAFGGRFEAVLSSQDEMARRFPAFRDAALAKGWRVEESTLLAGGARTLAVNTGQTVVAEPIEDRKRV